MAENIGLGEAISGGTGLSGDWGQPITRGFQLGQQYELAELQRQQQEQARLEKEMADFSKNVVYDKSKWYDPEIQRNVSKELTRINTEMFNAFKSRDRIKVAELEGQAYDIIAKSKILDNDRKALYGGNPSMTRKQAQSIYNKGNVQGIVEHNTKYPFAPIAQVDEESGGFKIIDVKDPNINKYLGREIKTQLETLVPTKRAGTAGNANVLTIDINSPEYKKAKIEVINKALNDKNFVADVVYTQDFKDYYDKFLQKTGIPYQEADDMDLSDALQGFMLEKYDQNEYIKPILQKQATSRSGGGSGNFNLYLGGKNVGKWDYEVDTDGGTFVQVAGNPEAHPSFTQGSELIETYSPKITYLGNDKFRVDYFEKLAGQEVKEKAEKPLIVSKKQMDSVFKLSEEGYKNFFPAYKAEKEKATKQPAPKGSTAPAKGKKMSFPMWKKQNPNGTIAQYKQYFNS